MTLVLALASLLNPAFAADSDASAGDPPDVRYQAVTDLIFDGVALEGKLLRPENLLVLERRRAKFNPMIRLRSDFDTEMVESVEQVR